MRKDFTIQRDEAEAVDDLASAIIGAMMESFDDPRGANGGDPFEPEDKDRIISATVSAMRHACERLGYGLWFDPPNVDQVRRIMDKRHTAEWNRRRAA